MKKNTNQIAYSTKGDLASFDNDIISTEIIGKNDIKTDSIDLKEMFEDIKTFCNSTIGRSIDLKFIIKVIDEELENTKKDEV